MKTIEKVIVKIEDLPEVLMAKDISSFLNVNESAAHDLLKSGQMPVICIRRSQKTRLRVWKKVFIKWLEGEYEVKERDLKKIKLVR